MMIPLWKIKDRHKFEKVFVVGSGPSLDAFDLDRFHAAPVVCMNEAINIVPDTATRYWVALDPEKYDQWGGTPPACIPVIGSSVLRNIRRDRPQNDPRGAFVEVDFHGVGDCYKSNLPAHIITSKAEATTKNTLYMNYGTASVACYLAWYLGAGMVELVGVDGGTGNAERIRPHYAEAFRAGRQEAHNYDLLRQCGTRVLDVLGVRYNQKGE